MKRHQTLFRLSFTLFLLAGEAYVSTGCTTSDQWVAALVPRHFFYSREDIQKKINQRWHFNKKVLQLIEVNIDSPRITLLPESNRLKCAFHLQIRPPLSHAIEGTITVAGALKFNSAARTIRLENTAVEAIDAEGMTLKDPLLQSISALFGGTLTDIPLYELKPEDLRYAGVQFDPITFTVTSEGVDVTMEARSKHKTN